MAEYAEKLDTTIPMLSIRRSNTYLSPSHQAKMEKPDVLIDTTKADDLYAKDSHSMTSG